MVVSSSRLILGQKRLPILSVYSSTDRARPSYSQTAKQYLVSFPVFTIGWHEGVIAGVGNKLNRRKSFLKSLLRLVTAKVFMSLLHRLRLVRTSIESD